MEAMNDLVKGWNQSGLHEGDTVLIHSNIVRTIRNLRKKGLKVKADFILESFIKAVGNTGTLLLYRYCCFLLVLSL